MTRPLVIVEIDIDHRSAEDEEKDDKTASKDKAAAPTPAPRSRFDVHAVIRCSGPLASAAPRRRAPACYYVNRATADAEAFETLRGGVE